jgi:hypothetical protein
VSHLVPLDLELPLELRNFVLGLYERLAVEVAVGAHRLIQGLWGWSMRRAGVAKRACEGVWGLAQAKFLAAFRRRRLQSEVVIR